MPRSGFLSIRPRKIRVLKHWALELVVVVVGVLLALMAAEWAEDRRDRAQAEQAVEAMARELQTISGGMYFGVQSWACQNEQIEKLYSALMDSEAPWDPAALAVVEVDSSREGRSSLPVYFDDAVLIRHFSARESAEALGALQKLSPDRAYPITFLYSVAETAYDANYRRYQASRALAALSLTEAPSSAERRALLVTLGEVNEQHELFLRYARGLLGLWDQFPEKPDTLPAEWPNLEPTLKERPAKLGDCAMTPSSEYWNGLLED